MLTKEGDCEAYDSDTDFSWLSNPVDSQNDSCLVLFCRDIILVAFIRQLPECQCLYDR